MYEIYEKLRTERKMNNHEVALKAKIAPSNLTRWKQGEYKPKYETMVKIANALEVPVSVFYKGVANEDQHS